MNEKCDGSCFEDCECNGTVKKVEVFDFYNKRSWGKYNYCDKAIEVDTKAGYEVVILGE